MPVRPRRRLSRWRLVVGALLGLAVLGLAVLNWPFLQGALSLAAGASLPLVVATAVVAWFSLALTTRVLVVALRWQGMRLGWARAWAVGVVAIVLSQSVPAGGVASFTYLVDALRRQGADTGQAALAALLELVSYLGAMLALLAAALLALVALGVTLAPALLVALGLAAGVALSLVGSGVWLLAWRPEWLSAWAERLARGGRGGGEAAAAVAGVGQGWARQAGRWRRLLGLLGYQLGGLGGQALALLLALAALGASPGPLVALVAVAIALPVSAFSLLPGGGGTVEAALIATLALLGVGPAAVPAVIIYRLLSYWLLIPVAATLALWLPRRRPAGG